MWLSNLVSSLILSLDILRVVLFQVPLCQRSKWSVFAKIVNDFKPLIILENAPSYMFHKVLSRPMHLLNVGIFLRLNTD